MYQRFRLPFEIMIREMLETARSGNAFAEHNLIIWRLDQLSRSEDIQAKLEKTDWDVIVCDEAHKMSASFFGGEVKATKSYRLGQLLGLIARHFLLQGPKSFRQRMLKDVNANGLSASSRSSSSGKT